MLVIDNKRAFLSIRSMKRVFDRQCLKFVFSQTIQREFGSDRGGMPGKQKMDLCSVDQNDPIPSWLDGGETQHRAARQERDRLRIDAR